MRMAMAFLMEADFHPEFPPRPGTLVDRLADRVSYVRMQGHRVKSDPHKTEHPPAPQYQIDR
jgi:hypothetical protein